MTDSTNSQSNTDCFRFPSRSYPYLFQGILHVLWGIPGGIREIEACGFSVAEASLLQHEIQDPFVEATRSHNLKLSSWPVSSGRVTIDAEVVCVWLSARERELLLSVIDITKGLMTENDRVSILGSNSDQVSMIISTLQGEG